jgi:hypothetical protein
VRVVPNSVTDQEMIALAVKWGGAKRMRRREGTVALRLETPQRATEMAADCKRTGLRLGGSEVNCFVASPEMVLDDEERNARAAVVPVRPKMPVVAASPVAPVAPVASAVAQPDGLSLLLQKLGAQIALPPVPVRGMNFSYDDEDDEEGNGEAADAARPAEVKPIALSSTASFLQQFLSKPVIEPTKLTSPKDLLSSLNSLRHVLGAVAKPAAAAASAAVPKPFVESPPVSPPMPGRESCRALSDFEAREDTQVSFKKGDIMTLRFCDDDSGWSEVEIRGRVGWVPTNFYEKI